jgi:hypothetical protein
VTAVNRIEGATQNTDTSRRRHTLLDFNNYRRALPGGPSSKQALLSPV